MSTRNFLTELFDANFNRYISLSIVKVIYVLGLIATTAASGLFVVVAFGGTYYLSAHEVHPYLLSDTAWVDIFLPFVVFPVAGGIFVLGALVSRVCCELIAFAFRIAENTSLMVERGEERSAAAADWTPVQRTA